MGKAGKNWLSLLGTAWFIAAVATLRVALSGGDEFPALVVLGVPAFLLGSAAVGWFGYAISYFVAVRFVQPKTAALFAFGGLVALAVVTAGFGIGAAAVGFFRLIADLSKEPPKQSPAPNLFRD